MVTMQNRTRAPHRIGILGGGQLGLMLSQALVALGAEVQIFDPNPDAPAARLTPYWKQIDFDDPRALRDAFASCDRITYEFEHIPTDALRAVTTEHGWADKLWPSLSVLERAQNRVAEKKALTAAGADVAAWQEIPNHARLLAVFKESLAKQKKFVLKTARGGYDGKGQWRLSDAATWHSCLDELAAQPQAFPLVLEEECELDMEVSVIVGRHPKIGAYAFPVVENRHVRGILDTTFSPPQLAHDLCTEASTIAQSIAAAWDVRGLLTVEFFVVRTPSGKKLLVNEVAPRPHNSGHITRCSMTRSQFDILAQILLDMPFSSVPTAASKSWCMWNTLGDLWTDVGLNQTCWNDTILASRHLCEAMLYGKPEARPHRKMGHVILTADDRPTLENAIETFRTSFHTHQKGFR
jgi:5-(carboxyamino)imidazole ribonucleotide synthase